MNYHLAIDIGASGGRHILGRVARRYRFPCIAGRGMMLRVLRTGGTLSGGIQATGNYPGKARNAAELMADLDFVMGLIPGTKRLNLHAMYAIADAPVERDKLTTAHFTPWLNWAHKRDLRLDFNPTLFSHAMVKDGLTLSHPNKDVRDYWIRHVKACRKIAASIGKKQGGLSQ